MEFDDEEWTRGNDSDWNRTDDDSEEDEDEIGDLLSVTSSVPTTRNSVTDEQTAASVLRQKEAQRIFSSTLVLIGFFIVVVVISAVAVYGFAVQQDSEVFEAQFNVYSQQLVDTATLRIEWLIQQMGSSSIAITNYALGTRQQWPFVTMSNFQVQASYFENKRTEGFQSGALSLSVIIKSGQKKEWEKYSTSNSRDWIAESSDYLGLDYDVLPPIAPSIYYLDRENGTKVEYDSFRNATDFIPEQFAPIWMVSLSDPMMIDTVNYDALDHDLFSEIDSELNSLSLNNEHVVITAPTFDTSGIATSSSTTNWPKSMVGAAVVDNFDSSSNSIKNRVATLQSTLIWHELFENILDDDEMEGPIIMVLENSCGNSFSYEITGSKAEFLKLGNILEISPNGSLPKVVTSFNSSSIKFTGGCFLTVHLSATATLQEASVSRYPRLYVTSIILLLCVMGIFFWSYARIINNKKERITKLASSRGRVSGLVSSVLPAGMRKPKGLNESKSSFKQASSSSTSLLDKEPSSKFLNGTYKPLADLHPNVTVLFADIENFTAWASVREPTQVFVLLETLYSSFDKLCTAAKIFKVETIGDCYVAVSGLPDPRDDHAVIMCQFARDILLYQHGIVKKLETVLGPDTGELAMRVGVNSGPVTAGVLRGAKSRFQLFGDTVNTASRMESTGMRNRIQVSPSTAELLDKGGKGDWLIPREDPVEVKGKGEMKTFWILKAEYTSFSVTSRDDSLTGIPNTMFENVATVTKNDSLKGSNVLDNSARSNDETVTSSSLTNPTDKQDRLVTWSADLLISLLKRIVAMRESEETLEELKDFQGIVKELDQIGGISARTKLNVDGYSKSRRGFPSFRKDVDKTVLDEVAEIIHLPRKAARYQQNPDHVQLGASVEKQVNLFVREVADRYRSNPFHNFEHASHVTQSLTKLLSRVVSSDAVDYEHMTYKKKAATSRLHKFTFGITSDPITQFACVFSALIHDMDHPGVPNAILVQEEANIASKYRNKSVAEQNSVDLAWSLMQEPRFRDLRQCIYKTQTELDRFRQLVVNSVMATDICDKELGQLRKNRWDRAFKQTDDLDESSKNDVNRKATIVIEHLIQAADVAHTMQHWHVYLKWNERFFHECYSVYKSGRTDKDPSEGWYKGEIGFFDFYIIPLAKKLENCGVFGVSSDECLQYAKANRDEWERKGESIVQNYISKYN